MARPEEKAQAMMNKWVQMREKGNITKPSFGRRPYLASQCSHLNDAERWRNQIIREISNGISKIQNPGLSEHEVRDLNDQINKLMREKFHWNKRIAELGGPDYNKIEKLNQLEEGADDPNSVGLQGSSGYRYYGVAKDLPGVKALFARNAVKFTKRKRGDIYKYITPDYYGLRDEEDGVLLDVEKEASEKRRKALETCRVEYKSKQAADDEEVIYMYRSDDESDEETVLGVMGSLDAIAAHVAIPTQEIVAQTILEKKKKQLLESLS